MSSPQSSRDVRIGGGRSTFLVLAGSAAFTIFGVALIAAPHPSVVPKVVGALTVAVFGSLFYLGVRLLRAGGMYVLTAGGIRFPFHKWPMLPWADVDGTRIVTRRGRRYLIVDARGADARVRHMKSGARAARRNIRSGLGLVPIPEQMAPTTLEELQREIERRRTGSATAAAASVDQAVTVLPAASASATGGGRYAAPATTRALRNVALANALMLLLAMLHYHAPSTHRAFLLADAVALLVGAAALQLERILAGSVTIVAAAIFLVVLDLTVGNHALATRVGYLFFPICVLLTALAVLPRRQQSS